MTKSEGRFIYLSLIADQFSNSDQLYELMRNNSEIASELFNVLNNCDFGKREECFLDDEHYSIGF